MDCCHSIVGSMVGYHWKPLKHPWVQWLLDSKTIGTNGLQTKNHCKTIDTNGCFPTIHLLAMVCFFKPTLQVICLKWPVFVDMCFHWAEIIPKMKLYCVVIAIAYVGMSDGYRPCFFHNSFLSRFALFCKPGGIGLDGMLFGWTMSIGHVDKIKLEPTHIEYIVHTFVKSAN